MNNRRIWGTLASFAANAVISYELWRLSPAELATLVFDIISRESLLVGGLVFASGAAAIFSWPAIVWCWNIPDRRAERHRQEAAAEAAEARRREAEARAKAEEELDRVAAPLQELLDRMSKRDVAGMTGPGYGRCETLPLRRVATRLFKRVNEPEDEEEVVRVVALLREIDALGLLPGGVPPLGSEEQGELVFPEHDGLDLDWPRETKRILGFLRREGLEATRAQVNEWYGHLRPAPFNGTHPAKFRLYGDSIDSIAEGRGRAEHTGPFKDTGLGGTRIPRPRGSAGDPPAQPLG